MNALTAVFTTLKLSDLKAAVYTLFNRCMGAKILQTKQLKKYYVDSDFRRRAAWESLATKLQIKVDQAFGFSDKLAAAIAQTEAVQLDPARDLKKGKAVFICGKEKATVYKSWSKRYPKYCTVQTWVGAEKRIVHVSDLSLA
jgi:hypothetical protein